MHLINPSKKPPIKLKAEAIALAVKIKAPIYLYQYSGGWGFTEKISKVPSGALIIEIKGDPDNPEAWNTGGC